MASLHRYLLEDCPDLVHNLQEVHHSPSFDDFSVNHALCANHCVGHRLSGRENTPVHPMLHPLGRVPRDNHVPFGNLILNADFQVRKPV